MGLEAVCPQRSAQHRRCRRCPQAAVRVWHVLVGDPPDALETDKSFTTKLKKLTVTLGKVLRAELGLHGNLDACVLHFQNQILSHAKIDMS